MALRCIKCNRSEHKATLDSNFMCVDKLECWNTLQQKQAPPSKVMIYVDCACDGPNTSTGALLGVGVYTTINGEHSPYHSIVKALPQASINVGEWAALVYGLQIAALMAKQGKYTFRIFGDSQVVMYAFNGQYKVSKKFMPYYIKADMLRQELGTKLLSATWICRDQNKKADALSKEALLLHKHPII